MSLKKNYMYNIAYQVLLLILPLVTSPYLSRTIGADGVGVYSYSYSIAYYFVLFAMLGVNNYGSREVAGARDDYVKLRKTFWSIWILQAILTVASSILYLGYIFMLSENEHYALIWLPFVLSSALDVNWLLFGLEKFQLTVSRNFAIKLITFVLTFVLVRGPHALEAYLALMSLSMVASAAALWPYIIKRVRPIRVTMGEVLMHIKPNLVLFVPVIAVSLYTIMDKVMLGVFSTIEEVGYYENAFKITSLPFTLITALGTVMLPRVSNLFSQGRKEEGLRYMAPSIWLALLLSIAFSFGLISISPEFPDVFFGSGFSGCSPVMAVLALAMPFMAWANVIRTQWLIPTKNDRAYIVSVVCGAAVNIGVNLLLIKKIGALGAAVGSFSAEVAVCLVQTAVVWNRLPVAKWIIESIPAAINGLLMFAVVRFIAVLLPAGFWGLASEVLVGAMVFSACSFTFYSITNNENFCRCIGEPLRCACRKLLHVNLK